MNRRLKKFAVVSALVLFGVVAVVAGNAVPKIDARPAWDAYVKAYWIPEKAQFRLHKGNDKKLLDFWFAAHAWDAILDASRIFKDAKTKAMVPTFYDAFMKRYPDWTKNHFNDDILWWTISCTRAYSATKDKRYLDQARKMFDWLLEHEVDDTLGGGMWWKNSEHKSKNACDNFPAVITACNLYRITKDRKYLTAAIDLYAWGRGAFFDEKTGAVYDNMNLKKHVTRWNFSYNLGTFIGAGIRLYRVTGRREYLNDALKAADNLTGEQSPGGILKAGGQKGDGGAFNGIGVRYLAELAAMKEGTKYRRWIAENAASAHAHARPSDGIIGTDWTKTPSDNDDIEGQIANSSMTLLILAQALSR